MKPEELQNKLQDKLDARLKQNEPHACILIFEDETVFITDKEKKVLPHEEPVKEEPARFALEKARWYSGSPICIWYRGKRR